MRAGIFIDDSGNPGTQTENVYDTTDRKSWYAVVLTSEQRIQAHSFMTALIRENFSIYGAKEFHFTDIFSGVRSYKGVSLDTRLQIFEHFATIFRDMKYPILHMTMTSADYERSKIVRPKGKHLIDGFDMTRHEDLTLCYLLLRCHYFLKKNRNGYPPVEIVIDAGRQKDGSIQEMNEFKSDFIDKTIRYVASEKEPMLQLADYAAFCLNRAYWLQNKSKRTDLDLAWLQIFAWADFQTLTMHRMLTDAKGDTKAIYEEMLTKAYKVNDDRNDIGLEEMLGQLDWNNP